MPFGVLPPPSFAWPAAFAFALGLLGVALGVRRSGWLVVGATVAVLGGPLLAPRPPLELTALPVGHGDALLVSSAGAHLLVDGGGVPEGIDPGARVVLPYLRERGIRRLDAVALSHPHPDHALGLLAVLREVPADRLWLPAGIERGPLVDAVLAAAGERAGRVALGGRGPHPGRGGGARCSLPAADARGLRTVNDRSLVLHLAARGRSVLLPGDAGAAAEEALPPLESTVVKVPHHGSRTSSTPHLVSASRAWLAALLRWPRQPLRPPRTGGGGALARERRRGAADRRRRGDPGRARRATASAGRRSADGPGGSLPAHLPPRRTTVQRRGDDPEDLDLAALSRELHQALGPGEPVGYLRGKAKMRDALVDLHGFSQLEAESVVDTLELQGYLHFLGDPRAPSEAESRWDFKTG